MIIHGKRPWYLDYLLILVGTCLMAVGISSIFDMAGLVTGGFSGAAIIVKKMTLGLIPGGVPLWTTNFVLNIPLFIIGFRIGGFHYIKKDIAGELLLSFWLAVLPTYDLAGDDLLLAAIYGGVIQGIGIGLVFLGQGTTGGTDMMAALIQKKMRHYSVAQVMQVIDGLIVAAGVFVFGVQKALYAIIAVYLVTKVSDGMIEGMKFSKESYIITSKPEEIAHMIMEELDRGVTGIRAVGMYSGEEKLMLYCVVDKKQIVTLKERVGEIDPDAFVIVSDAREVHGEGFIEKK
ncbi:MAG: YitT family protein [Eubacteriales bacterium]|nr:YitT family protein [Eubacteriales bacterium]